MALLSKFGLNSEFPEFADEAEVLQCYWHRKTVSWEEIEPVDGGGYVWPAWLDALSAAVVTRGVRVILTTVDTPEWAQLHPRSGPPPTCDMPSGTCSIQTPYFSRFKDFMQALAARYAGTLQDFEICNEVTLTDPETGDGIFFEQGYNNYKDWLQYGAQGAKAGNANAKIWAAGLVDPRTVSGAFFTTLFTEDNYIDYYHIHVYGSVSDVTAAVQFMRQKMSASGITKPLFLSETASGGKLMSIYATQAQDVPKRFANAFARGISKGYPGVDGAFWWPLCDTPTLEEDPGTTNPETKFTALGWSRKEGPRVFHLRPAYTAFQTMVGKIGGFTDCRDLTHTVKQFVVNGRLLWLAWAGAGTQPAFSGPIRVTTHMGSVSLVDAASLVLTEAPVYIELVPNLVTTGIGLPGDYTVSSDTDIANIALGIMGKARVGDISENDTIATAFPALRDALLSDHPWQFATYYTSLTEDATGTASEWDHAFHLPTDPPFLEAQEINGTPWFPGDNGDSFEIASGQVLTNETSVVLKYTAAVTDSALYDPMFVMCLATLLAATIAPNLAPTTARTAQLQHDAWMQKARARDARQGQNRKAKDTSLRDARF